MIDFRYHVVSIVAVFLALAIGIVLGTTTLQGPVIKRVSNVAQQLRDTNEGLRAQVVSLRQQVEADQQLLSDVTTDVVTGRLRGERVVIVEAPGASEELARKLADEVKRAGAGVTGHLTMQRKYLDNSETGVVGELALRLAPSELQVSDNASPYERSAAVLAEALVGGAGKPSGKGGEWTQRRTILSGFETAGYLTPGENLDKRATLAVVVAPGTPYEEKGAAADNVADNVADNNAVIELATALDQRGQGAAVVGPKDTTTEGSLVHALRSSDEAAGSVSTVDYADTATGRIVTVLALSNELQGENGHYGVGERAEKYLPEMPDSMTSGEGQAS